MRKFILLSALTLAIVLSGCGNSTRNLTGDAPPKVVVEADGEISTWYQIPQQFEIVHGPGI